MKQETILCIEEAIVAGTLQTIGFVPIEDVDLYRLWMPQHLWFAPRAAVEHRFEFRQIIPYIVLRCRAALVVYQRTSKGSESRLHGVLSLGFGGHVGIDDAVLEGAVIDLESTLQRAAERELSEELAHMVVERRRRLGLIYAHDDDVSRVHLGVVEVWDIRDASVTSAETAIEGCRMVPIDHLRPLMPQMEGWSRLCIPPLEVL